MKLQTSSRSQTQESRDFARRLRREMSYSEKILWASIRKDQLGVRFRRQTRIGRWFLDFYCPDALLNVEIDGEQHLRRAEIDRVRDEELAEKGILTFRIPSLSLQDGAAYTGAFQEMCTILSARTGKQIPPPRTS